MLRDIDILEDWTAIKKVFMMSDQPFDHSEAVWQIVTFTFVFQAKAALMPLKKKADSKSIIKWDCVHLSTLF